MKAVTILRQQSNEISNANLRHAELSLSSLVLTRNT